MLGLTKFGGKDVPVRGLNEELGLAVSIQTGMPVRVRMHT